MFSPKTDKAQPAQNPSNPYLFTFRVNLYFKHSIARKKKLLQSRTGAEPPQSFFTPVSPPSGRCGGVPSLPHDNRDNTRGVSVPAPAAIGAAGAIKARSGARSAAPRLRPCGASDRRPPAGPPALPCPARPAGPRRSPHTAQVRWGEGSGWPRAALSDPAPILADGARCPPDVGSWRV